MLVVDLSEMRQILKILFQSVVITAISAAVALVTNGVRSEGIPIIAQIPYEIFSACKDSEAASVQTTVKDLEDESVLYVDARPREAFTKEHWENAVNVPFSVLYGASDADIQKVKDEVKKRSATTVVVYGLLSSSPDQSDVMTDLAKPLAQQLIEAGISGVRHVAGGLEALKKNTSATVQPKRDGNE